MKHLYTFVFAVILAFIGNGLHAQSFDGGLVAGPVVSQIDGDGYAGFHQLGLTAGAFARIPTDGPISWQMELKYSLYGSHSGANEVVQGMNPMNIRLHYIEVPVLFRYNLSKLNINGFSLDFITVEAGVSADILLRGTQSANFEDNFDNGAWWLFTATGNVGLQFDLNDRLGFNIRSMNSIIPCRLHPEAPVLSFYHYYNIALQATVVYTIVHAD